MPPRKYYDRFAENTPDSLLHPIELRTRYAEAVQEAGAPGNARFAEMVARYDAEIAYTDDCIKRLVEGLEARGRLDNTVIVVTAPHGEEFLDHGYIGHAWTLYQEAVHVPLIMYGQGTLRPGRIAAPVSLADLFPTLLDLLSVPQSASDLDGASFLVAQADHFAFVPLERPQIAELVVRELCILRTVTRDGWKYLAAQHWPAPAQRHGAVLAYRKTVEGMRDGTIERRPLWDAPVHEELYDLAEDPGEQRNLAGENPEQIEALREALAAYRRHCEANGLSPRDPPREIEMPEATNLEELESIGYL